MKTKKKWMKKILSLMMTAMLVAGLSTTAFAANQGDVGETPLPTATLTAEKIFNADVAGNLNKLADATFTLTRTAYNDGPTNSTITGVSDIPMPTGAVGNSETVTVNSFTTAGTSKSGTAAFGVITYSVPGTYTYELVETVSTRVPGITYDEVKRYINVYVENIVDAQGNVTLNDDGTPYVKIAGIVVWKDGASGSTPTTPPTTGKESGGTVTGNDGTATISFTNVFGANANDYLEVSKAVKGSAGDTMKDFTFTLTTSNNPVTNPLAYQVFNAANVAQTGTGKAGTIASGGTFNLKHGEYVRIYGMENNATYTITEATNDYTTDITGNSDGAAITPVTGITGTTLREAAQQTFKITAVDNQIFTNTKNSSTPTGIMMDVLPFVLLIVIAGIGVFAMISKKKSASVR